MYSLYCGIMYHVLSVKKVLWRDKTVYRSKGLRFLLSVRTHLYGCDESILIILLQKLHLSRWNGI